MEKKSILPWKRPPLSAASGQFLRPAMLLYVKWSNEWFAEELQAVTWGDFNKIHNFVCQYLIEKSRSEHSSLHIQNFTLACH